MTALFLGQGANDSTVALAATTFVAGLALPLLIEWLVHLQLVAPSAHIRKPCSRKLSLCVNLYANNSDTKNML